MADAQIYRLIKSVRLIWEQINFNDLIWIWIATWRGDLEWIEWASTRKSRKEQLSHYDTPLFDNSANISADISILSSPSFVPR